MQPPHEKRQTRYARDVQKLLINKGFDPAEVRNWVSGVSVADSALSSEELVRAFELREKIRQLFKRQGYDVTEVDGWLNKPGAADLLKHGEDLVRSFDRDHSRPLPHPEMVVDQRSNLDAKMLTKIVPALFSNFGELKRRLSQPGFKRHGMEVFEIIIARRFLTYAEFLAHVAEITGLTEVAADNLAQAVFHEFALILKKAIKDGEF